MFLRLVLRLFSTLSMVLLLMPMARAQGVTRQAFKDSVQNLPYFSIHKDNYFISGIPTNTSINSNTANAKYQISFKQMITRSALPFDTYLFFTYSQKAFWDVYKESYPFREINFNPTLGVGKAIFDSNDRLKGVGSVYFEHESNGRDSIFSRSWNRLSLEYATTFSDKLRARAKIWLPFAFKESNPDILDYRGLGELQLSYEAKPDKLYIEVLLRKGWSWDTKGTFRPRIYFNPFRRNIANQYLMIEWYVGQAESLIDYKPFTSMIRIGYVVKSNELNFLNAK